VKTPAGPSRAGFSRTVGDEPCAAIHRQGGAATAHQGRAGCRFRAEGPYPPPARRNQGAGGCQTQATAAQAHRQPPPAGGGCRPEERSTQGWASSPETVRHHQAQKAERPGTPSRARSNRRPPAGPGQPATSRLGGGVQDNRATRRTPWARNPPPPPRDVQPGPWGGIRGRHSQGQPCTQARGQHPPHERPLDVGTVVDTRPAAGTV